MSSPQAITPPPSTGAAAERGYISREDRLMSLPEVFSLNQLARSLGQSKLSASIYIVRWEKDDLIVKAGERAGIYFNNLRNPNAKDERMWDAILLRHPEAVRRGVRVLMEQDWLKPDSELCKDAPRISIAVPAAGNKQAKWNGVDVVGRPANWFESITPFAGAASSERLRVLSPAAALVDLCRGRGDRQSVVPVSELVLDQVDWSKVSKAFKAFGQRVPQEYSGFVAAAFIQGQHHEVQTALKPSA